MIRRPHLITKGFVFRLVSIETQPAAIILLRAFLPSWIYEYFDFFEYGDDLRTKNIKF
jgi:hypothetical protein